MIAKHILKGSQNKLCKSNHFHFSIFEYIPSNTYIQATGNYTNIELCMGCYCPLKAIALFCCLVNLLSVFRRGKIVSFYIFIGIEQQQVLGMTMLCDCTWLSFDVYFGKKMYPSNLWLILRYYPNGTERKCLILDFRCLFYIGIFVVVVNIQFKYLTVTWSLDCRRIFPYLHKYENSNSE